MAIERAEEFSESEEVSPDMKSEMEMEGEPLPQSLLGGKQVSPGDVVRIAVVSVDPESGTWHGKYADSKPMKSAIESEAESITM